MSFRKFNCFILFISTFLGGCTFFQDQDEELLPAELVKYDELLNIKKVWGKGIGKGSEQLHLSLKPSGNSEVIYTASHDGKVSSIEAVSGRVFWRKDLSTNLTAGPAITDTRLVVFGLDGDLICLRTGDGSEAWRTSIKGESIATPIIANDNVIIHTIDGQLRSFSIFDGTERWSLSQDMPSLTLRGSSSPVILGNNVVSAFDNGRVILVNIETGMVIWEAMLSPPTGRSALERLIDIDGTIKTFGQDIYLAGYQSKLVSLAAESGQIIWSKDLSTQAGIDIDDEHIVVTSEEGFVLGLSRNDGSEIWRNEILIRREVTAPVIFDSTVVVGDLEGYVHFFDISTGDLLSRRRAGKGAISGHPVVIGGYLYVQNETGELTVFSSPDAEDAPSRRFKFWGT